MARPSSLTASPVAGSAHLLRTPWPGPVDEPRTRRSAPRRWDVECMDPPKEARPVRALTMSSSASLSFLSQTHRITQPLPGSLLATQQSKKHIRPPLLARSAISRSTTAGPQVPPAVILAISSSSPRKEPARHVHEAPSIPVPHPSLSPRRQQPATGDQQYPIKHAVFAPPLPRSA